VPARKKENRATLRGREIWSHILKLGGKEKKLGLPGEENGGVWRSTFRGENEKK